MNLLVYLLKVSLALSLCCLLYRTTFRRLSFFQWNRFYLLASVVLSFILPLLPLQMGNTMLAVADFGGIDWTYVDHLVKPVPGSDQTLKGSWSPAALALAIHAGVALLHLAGSAQRLRKLGMITRGARCIRRAPVKVYLQYSTEGSFTLFRRIYLDRYAHTHQLRPVLKHEMVHALQLHSLDLVFMEFVVAMLWFNPFVYVHLRSIRENHEYLADRAALGEEGSLIEYLECLKAETVRYFSPVPASSFKSSTIKKRIIMLTNHKSKRRALWRYLAILPLLSGILVLCQTPARPVLAGTNVNPNFDPYGIPSLFPLPEEYREKVTWDFEQEAIHPISRQKTMHLGIDLAAPTGTPVYAAAGGVVRKAQEEKGWGKLVVIEHEGAYTTFYAHLNEIEVENGTRVQKGEVIGRVGNTGQSTGSHLHYEVRRQGKHVNPSDFF